MKMFLYIYLVWTPELLDRLRLKQCFYKSYYHSRTNEICFHTKRKKNAIKYYTLELINKNSKNIWLWFSLEYSECRVLFDSLCQSRCSLISEPDIS